MARMRSIIKGYEYGLFRQLAAARAVVEYLSDADGGVAALREVAQIALEDVGRDDIVPRPRRVGGDVMVHDDRQFPALIGGRRRAYQKKRKKETDDSFHKITPNEYALHGVMNACQNPFLLPILQFLYLL